MRASGRRTGARLWLLVGLVGLALAWGGVCPGRAQGQQPGIPEDHQQALSEAARLNEQVQALYRQGKAAEAVPLAERALVLRRKALGEEHPDTATSLNNLAFLYKAMSQYGKAEPLY